MQLSAMEALVLEAEQRKQKAAAFEKSPFSDYKGTSPADKGDWRERKETEESHTSPQPRPPQHKYAGADW